MKKRWAICASIAATSAFAAACGDDTVTPQEVTPVPYCDTAQCPKGTTCNEERRMCVSDAPGVVETNPCDKCTENQECVNKTCVDKEPEPPLTLCSETDAPTCNGNAVVTCVEGELVPTDCEDKVCKEGKCVDNEIEDPDACDATEFELYCDGNSVVSCVENRLKTEPCLEGHYCDAGECYDTDYCPDNPDKMAPGVCGCALSDADLDGNGKADCLDVADLCPDDSDKTHPGQCGCGIAEGTCDGDMCPDNPAKVVPGICGCDAEDADSDHDGIPDCIDTCPGNPYKFVDDGCACDLVQVSIDSTNYCAIPIGTSQGFVDVINGIADGTVEVKADSVYALVRDINLSDVISDATEWKPVTFNGKLTSGGNSPKTIAYANADGERLSLHCADTDVLCGLFGTLSGARIHGINLNLGVSGKKSVGGLAGVANSDTKLTGIHASTDVTGAGSDVGGLIGSGSHISLSGITHQGKVINIGANVSGDPVTNTGGIAGSLIDSSVISDSQNAGRVVSESENVDTQATNLGGIVGYADTGTSLFDLTNDSIVSTLTSINVGGIAGYHKQISTKGNKNFVNNGYVKGYQYVGGLFGRLDNVSGAEGITDSVNHGTVAGLWQHSGGIVGYTSLPLRRVINDGTVSGSTFTGGISGTQNNTANYALNKGMVWGENAQQSCGTYIGGLFGSMTGGYEHSYLTNHGQVTADWAPRMAVNGSTGVQSADDCPNRYFAGVVGYISDGSGTKMSNVLNTGNVTTSASGLGRAGGIAGWAHSLSLINAKNTGGVKGSQVVGGVVGRLLLRGNSSSKNFPFVWKSVENSGQILSNSTDTGGIIGDLYIENEQTECSFEQLVNSGTVSSSSNYVGGIIGFIKENNKTATFKNLFNTGNIKGSSYVGGIIGAAEANTNDWWEGETFRFTATGERTMTYTFDSCVSTGNITSNGSYVGGLFGRVAVPAIAAFAKRLTAPNSTTKLEENVNAYSVVRCKGNTNIYTRTIDLHYYNTNSIFNLQNSYFSGNITSTNNGSNVGGLFGQLESRSEVRTYNNVIRGYDSACNTANKTTESYTVTRLARSNIKNSYSLGTISGEHDYTGTLFGRLLTQDNVADTDAYKKQIMGEGKKTVSTVSNVYSSASLTNKGSAVAGCKEDNISCLTASNIYTWSGGTPGNLVWGTNTSLTGHSAFTYNESGIPMVGTAKLLDKLNTGATSLSLTSWKGGSYVLPDKKTVTVPVLDLKPQLTVWEPWEGE